MSLRDSILAIVRKKEHITTAELVEQTDVSRAYAHRILKELCEEGRLVRIGNARRSQYVLPNKEAIAQAKRPIRDLHSILLSRDLSEDVVFKAITRETGIFLDTREEAAHIVAYMFTEMLNNAIEHSQSKKIEFRMTRDDGGIAFWIRDWGIGAFNNIIKNRHVNNELEAIQEILKGKQTTDPAHHSGQGIFFTSKLADYFVLESGKKQLQVDNRIDDLFVKDISALRGTRVGCLISLDTEKSLRSVFGAYTDAAYQFSKTKVMVSLFEMGSEFLSRSEARRVLVSLDKFKEITLDFKGVKSIGQGFADQIFRVWQSEHPDIAIITKNAHENVQFMIDRVGRA